MITLDQFKEADLRVGTVRAAERIDGSDKLLKLMIDLGEPELRQILSGIAKYVGPEDVVGKQFVFIVNLEPRAMMGMMSHGMLLATGEGETFSMLSPTKEVAPGSAIR